MIGTTSLQAAVCEWLHEMLDGLGKQMDLHLDSFIIVRKTVSYECSTPTTFGIVSLDVVSKFIWCCFDRFLSILLMDLPSPKSDSFCMHIVVAYQPMCILEYASCVWSPYHIITFNKLNLCIANSATGLHKGWLQVLNLLQKNVEPL